MSDRRLGKLGEFPEGKLNAHDEGAIRIALGVQRGNVIIEFGASVTWLGFPPEQAESLAAALIAKAREARVSQQ